MTVDRLSIEALSEDEQAWLDVLWSKLSGLRTRNLIRAAYYDTEHTINTAGTVIGARYRSLAAVLGWNAKAVDSLTRRCNPEGFFWPDGDLGSVGYTDLLESNRLIAEVKSGLVESAVQGVSFLVTTQGDEPAGEPAALVHVKDALNSTGLWNPRTRGLDAALSVTSWAKDDASRPTGIILYLDGLTVTADREDGRWQVDRQTHPWGVPVEPLIYKPRAGKVFGSSRITRPQMFLQDAAVRAVLRMEGHMDVYSIPQMIILGALESIFKNADGTQKSGLEVALGRVLGIPDDEEQDDPKLARAEVKQFPAQSPEPHLAQLSVLAKLFARESSLPDSALAITDMANPTSADAYVAANDELIAEAEGATDDWSVPLRRTVARALAIQNDEDDWTRFATVDVNWRSPVHVSRAAAADAGVKQLTAVPWLAETEVGLELLGLSESQMKRALSERARARGRATLAQLVSGGAVPVADAG